MGYREIALDYYGGDTNFLIECLANTSGNTNGEWIDTSIYSTNANQSNVSLQPILTDDVFGVGNKGYVFSTTSSMEFITASQVREVTNDTPFTIEVKFKISSTPTTNGILSKGTSTNREWVIYLSNDRIRFHIFSEGSSTNYIGIWIMVAPQINTEYTLKFKYTGSKLATGITGYLNGTTYTSSRITVGTYNGMGIVNANLLIGQGDYNAINGAISYVKLWKGVV